MTSDDLTNAQAAQVLGVSAGTVRAWAAAGRLPHRRTAGGHRRFPRADVERLAREGVPDATLSPRAAAWREAADRLLRAAERDLVESEESARRFAAARRALRG